MIPPPRLFHALSVKQELDPFDILNIRQRIDNRINHHRFIFPADPLQLIRNRGFKVNHRRILCKIDVVDIVH